jgi:flagellar basal body rod protein FlgG
MDPLTITAASGLRSRMDALDLLSNNLANTSTAGYKADRESYNLYMSAEAAQEATGLSVRSPLVERQWIDFSQGSLQSTGNATDLAISGKGFFLVEGPQGTLLTRGGPISINKEGKLTTREGYEFVTVEPRRIRADALMPVEIDSSGVVRQAGQSLGQIKLVESPEPAGLSRREGVYMALDTRQAGQLKTAAAEVKQGHIEASNIGPAEAAVRLVNILRQFETLQKAIQIGGEMNRRAVEEVAKVHP